MSGSGIVYLVGTGPGDPGLASIAARELVERADVIVYDRLIPRSLLGHAHDSCERIDVGKRAGDHTMRQDDINAVLVEHARAGKTVVRLKGGDPYLFGRGGEEGAWCVQHGVPFQTVSGVTSAIAGPASAGIPVTHRGVSTHVTIVTAASGPSGDGDPDYEWLARSDGTVVLLMGLSRVRHIAEQLVNGGADPTRPTAVVSQATTSTQQTIVGTLATIADLVDDAELPSPAIVVVGDVVTLRETLDWFEQRPLFGRTIAVTRARAQASTLAARLSEQGAHVIECPTIQIVPLPLEPIQQLITAAHRPDFLVVTSVNAVDALFAALDAINLDSRALQGIKLCSIGPATTAALLKRGIVPDHVTAPGRATSQGMLEVLSEGPMWDATVAVLRAEDGVDTLLNGLTTFGAQPTLVPAYRTIINVPDTETVTAALRSDVVTLASGSAARNFAEMIPDGVPRPPAVTIGPTTTAAAEELGFEVVAQAHDATVDALVLAVCEHLTATAAER
jgi:uroporphyrinogen III methyltransferase/synthase